MADLVIKIPEEVYRYAKKYNVSSVLALREIGMCMNAIANGIPLPKGHGRIGDLDALRKEVSSWGMNDYEPSDFIDAIDEAETIIEANEESKET